jgi:four helix bundle protein
MAIQRYRDLIAWQKAMDLVVRVYDLTDPFPPKELYLLTSQIRRAAVSVPSNIAEGQGRRTTREFARHLSIARGSIQELETQVILATKLNYMTESVRSELLERTSETSRLVTGLLRSLRNKTARGE